MKKRILTIFLCAIFIFTISGCTRDEKISENFEPTEIDGISMAIKENSLTNEEATVIIKDTNGKGTYVNGNSFRIDKKENDNWVTPKETGKNCGFDLIAYYVNDEGILEMKQNWECMHGSLDKGTYRLVKDIFLESDTPSTEINKKYISVEFTIE